MLPITKTLCYTFNLLRACSNLVNSWCCGKEDRTRKGCVVFGVGTYGDIYTCENKERGKTRASESKLQLAPNTCYISENGEGNV